MGAGVLADGDGEVVGVGVEEGELCCVVDGTADDEEVSGVEDGMALLVEVCGGGDDEGPGVLDEGEVLAGSGTVVLWRGARMFIAGELSCP